MTHAKASRPSIFSYIGGKRQGKEGKLKNYVQPTQLIGKKDLPYHSIDTIFDHNNLYLNVQDSGLTSSTYLDLWDSVIKEQEI